MVPKVKLVLGVALLMGLQLRAQIDGYGYKRELIGVNQQWHRVQLPNDIFAKLNRGMSDIRIYGLTTSGDTIEAPYFLKLSAGQEQVKDVVFRTINQSRTERGHYFTFEVPSEELINTINLDFAQRNFDWRVTLEGSHNQKDWFTIVDGYRVLSVQNDQTNFQFTKVAFPNSNYRFFRLFVPSSERAELLSASILLHRDSPGVLNGCAVKQLKVDEDTKRKQTCIDVELNSPLPVCYLKIAVNSTYDFYRPITIRYLSDSVKTEQGWVYSYGTLTSGTLNSLDDNVFRFTSTTLRKLRIEVSNHDNTPLPIGVIEVKGYNHELVARFAEPATYFLVYGNSHASEPQYDILEFPDRIPSNPTALKLGEELQNPAMVDTSTPPIPLFRSKLWLWAVMLVVIAVLGWFTARMVRRQ